MEHQHTQQHAIAPQTYAPYALEHPPGILEQNSQYTWNAHSNVGAHYPSALQNENFRTFQLLGAFALGCCLTVVSFGLWLSMSGLNKEPTIVTPQPNQTFINPRCNFFCGK